MLDERTLTLVAITDDLRDGAGGIAERAAAAVRGGATMVQLRLKHASGRELVEVARRLVATLPVPVIVNDRADVALAAGATGVHLGADDLPVPAVRAVAPPGFIIGASLGDASQLPHAEGADYVGIGPVFATTSKDDAGAAIGVAAFARLRELAGLPAVAIGGITPENAGALRAAGSSGISVIRAVFGVGDPEAAARRLREAFEGGAR